MPGVESSLNTIDLLNRRCDGRIRGHEFCNRTLYDPSHFTLSKRHQLVGAQNGSSLHCIDISDRFIIAGNTSIFIYDLTERNAHGRHQVLQQTANATSAGLCALQWYRPDDTGVFITGSFNGTAHVWDTANMVAVLTLRPFEKTLRTLRLNPERDAFAAAGSYDDPVIKLLDLKSGTSSHALTPPTMGGTSDIQWSPTYEYMLASCSRDSIIRLWDIRRPNQVLVTLSNENQVPDIISAVPWQTVGKQLAKQKRRHTSTMEDCVAGTHVQFVGNHWLVALDGNKGDIHVWDLRLPQPVRRPGRYVNPQTNGKPLYRNVRRQPCVVGSRGKSIWVASAPRIWAEYPLENHTDGKPLQTLQGHLGEILCAAATPTHMVTAGADALALIWERTRRRRSTSSAVVDRDSW